MQNPAPLPADPVALTTAPAAATPPVSPDAATDLPGSLAPTDRSDAGKWLVLLAAFLGWMFDGLEMGIFPQISRPALTHLLGLPVDAVSPTLGWWNNLIAAMFLWGAAVGGLVFG